MPLPPFLQTHLKVLFERFGLIHTDLTFRLQSRVQVFSPTEIFKDMPIQSLGNQSFSFTVAEQNVFQNLIINYIYKVYSYAFGRQGHYGGRKSANHHFL